MAGVENPDGDGGGGGAVEAEPAEWCRCVYTCATGSIIFLALIVLCLYTVENLRPASNLLGIVAGMLVLLATLLAAWFGVVFVVLVAEWYSGDPPEGGQRFVDGLIQSDRGFLHESLRQYIRRIDALRVDA